jgi:hypothetical protein
MTTPSWMNAAKNRIRALKTLSNQDNDKYLNTGPANPLCFLLVRLLDLLPLKTDISRPAGNVGMQGLGACFALGFNIPHRYSDVSNCYNFNTKTMD